MNTDNFYIVHDDDIYMARIDGTKMYKYNYDRENQISVIFKALFVNMIVVNFNIKKNL